MKSVFDEYIKNLKKNKKNTSIVVVGSSYDLDFSKQITDIDLFVVNEDAKEQIRKVNTIDGLTFDTNYFDEVTCCALLKKREYFFLKGLSKCSVLYDSGFIKKIKDKAVLEYNKGPLYSNENELYMSRISILDDIEYIQNRIVDSDEKSYMLSCTLREVFKYYFYKNNIWIPKNKKMFDYFKKNEKQIYTYIKKLYASQDINDLKKIMSYIDEGAGENG